MHVAYLLCFGRPRSTSHSVAVFHSWNSEASCSTGYSPMLNFETEQFDTSVARMIQHGAVMDGPVRFLPHGRVRFVWSLSFSLLTEYTDSCVPQPRRTHGGTVRTVESCVRHTQLLPVNHAAPRCRITLASSRRVPFARALPNLVCLRAAEPSLAADLPTAPYPEYAPSLS